MKKKRILADILLVAGVLAAALIVFLLIPRGGGSTVVVTVDGKEYASLPLDEDAELLIESEGGTNLLIISGGKAYVVEADCPDRLCVRQGWIGYDGESIVCLPHKLTVTVRGGAEGRLDATAG